MCGRYCIYPDELLELRELIEYVERKYGEGCAATGEIFPTNRVPVLVWEENRLAPRPVYWGFPRYNGGGAVINARAETALEKSMFRRPLLTRRCVIPTSGFFEWKHVEGKKQKERYHLLEPGKKLLFMAGMTSTFADANGGSYEAFTILTTEANGSIAALHNRMPVILQPEEREAWLCDNAFMTRVLARGGPSLIAARVAADRRDDGQISLFECD